MPPFPPVPNVNKVVLSGVASNSNWANVIYFRYTGGPPTVPEQSSAATAVANAWNSQISGLMNLQTILKQVDVIDLSSSSSSAATVLVSHPGTSSVTPLGGNTAMVIKKHIARRYRGGHPKTFLVAKDSDSLFDQDSWKAAYVTSCANGWVSFISALIVAHGSATWTEEVNVSYYQGYHNVTYPSGRVKSVPTLRSTPLVDTIQTYTAETKVGSQRRRTSGG